jgi:hypothetical protein
MAKSSIFSELKRGARKLHRQVKKARTKRKIKNRAAMAQAKQNVKKQDLIRKESRMTAAQVRREGNWNWEGDGLHPDTVMEPVQNRHGGWEWEPVNSAANRRLQEKHRRVVHTGNRDMGNIKLDSKGVPVCPGCGYSMQSSPSRGHTCPNYCGISTSYKEHDSAQTVHRCGAPTKDQAPCQRYGDCPVPAHKKWRKEHGR